MDYGEPGGSYPGFPIPVPLNINAETMFGHCPKTKKRKREKRKANLLQESMQSRVRIGVLGDFEKGSEQIIYDFSEILDQSVDFVDVEQSWNLN